MAKRKSQKHRGGQRSSQAATAASLPEASGVSAAAYAWGIVLTALSAGTSLMLVLEHLGGLSLPGFPLVLDLCRS